MEQHTKEHKACGWRCKVAVWSSPTQTETQAHSDGHPAHAMWASQHLHVWRSVSMPVPIPVVGGPAALVAVVSEQVCHRVAVHAVGVAPGAGGRGSGRRGCHRHVPNVDVQPRGQGRAGDVERHVGSSVLVHTCPRKQGERWRAKERG